MGVLDAVAQLLTVEIDLDVVLGRMVDVVARELGAERATLFLRDPATGGLVSKAAHLPELPFIRLAPGQGIASIVAETGTVLNLPKPDSDPRWYEGVDRETGFRTRCLLAVPVRIDAVVGVLQVLNKRDGVFTEGDEAFALALAAQVAQALACTSLGARLRPGLPGPPVLQYRYNRIVGDSPAMAAVYERVRRAAATDATVLITGESGTGKELIARAVATNGSRRDKPFVKVDCAALPPTLVENELFGHARGAYTGADRAHTGKFEAADGGTLFLDEVGELPASAQGKLLRFLQDREIEPIGSGRAVTVDVRVISATNRDLAALVEAGQFRQDLFYRLRVVQIALPPLRERGLADVEGLVEHFLQIYGRKHGAKVRGLSPDAWARLRLHAWPGNVRELEHCIEAAVVLTHEGWIAADHLGLPASGAAPEEAVAPTLAEVERRHILRVLAAVDGNRSRAAEVLGIGRSTLARKLKEMGL
ncbi:MAG: hypothetical protein AMXMBFR64_47930 [Myxococcales bacterium]